MNNIVNSRSSRCAQVIYRLYKQHVATSKFIMSDSLSGRILLASPCTRPSLLIRSLSSTSPASKSRLEVAQPGAQVAWPSDPNNPASKPTNKHLSVDANGDTQVDLSFIEEPLGIGKQEQAGWPRFKFEDAIGPEGRYIVKRKLGYGMNSSVWLAYDQQ